MYLRNSISPLSISCVSLMLFSLLMVLRSDAKLPDSLLKQKEAVVVVSVNDKNGKEVASGKGVIVAQDGIIAASAHLIVKWLDDIEYTLTVHTENGSYPLDSLISYNSKLNVTLLKIEATGLPIASLDSGYKTRHERDAVTSYIVKSIERYRKTAKRTQGVPEVPARPGKPIEDLKSVPDSAESYVKHGNAYAAADRYPEAIDAYTQAIRMKPDYGEAYVNLGSVYYRLGRYHEAIEAYQKASALNPHSPAILNKLGILHVIQGEYAQAIETFKKALGKNPQNPETHYHLGVTYFLSGNRDAALEEYILLNRIDTQHAENLFDLMYR